MLSALLFTSCANGQVNKQGAGGALGLVSGGILGAQFGKGEGRLLAAGLGAIIGGLVGSSIGKSLDEHDQLMMERASQKSLEYAPTGSKTEWRNPDSGHHGYVVPAKAYTDRQGAYCREYTQIIVVGDQEEKGYGTACRQPDGQWKIIN